MAKRVQALVEPSILIWARESAGYSIEDVAKHFKKNSNLIEAWEQGKAAPFMGQLRNLATFYKRSISDFYLPAPPVEKPLPHDFRRSPGEVSGRYSPMLRRQLRLAQERQELTRYLYEILDEEAPAFEQRIALKDSPEDVGKEIRKILDIDFKDQCKWHQPYAAIKAWRTKIEELGVLVFQFENVDVSEAWGFSITDPMFPVIGINKTIAPNGRTFTMLHEFSHLLLGESSICDIDDYTPRNPRELRIEVFCNHAAAAALMPKEHFMRHEIFTSREGASNDWTDEEIRELADVFCVSREATVRRLLTFKKTTTAFYQKKRAAYQAQIAAQRAREREKNKNKPFGGQNRAQRALSDFGQNFVRTILSSYSENRITLADAASYLEVRAPKIREVQKLAFRG